MSTNQSKNNTSLKNKLIDKLSDAIISDQAAPNQATRYAILTDEQKNQLQEIEERALSEFTGVLDELEAALGMLRVGHHMGWRVLYLVHSKKTIRKYEAILNIKIREIFPEEGPSAYRSIGLGIANKLSNFWKVVSGEVKIDRRREIE